jgi:two-component sensor histidine kinase
MQQIGTIPARMRTVKWLFAPRPGLMRYGVAVVSVGLMALLQWTLNAWLEVHTRFMFFLPAVMLASWYGGFSAALLAISLGAVMGAYFFVTVSHGPPLPAYGDLHGLFVYLMAGLMIALLNQMQRQAQRRAELAHLALQERQSEIESLNLRLQRSMTETYHRVKNNLQVVAALIEMIILDNQETVHTDKLRQVNQHIRALAAINDLLTQETRSGREVRELSSRMVLDKLMLLLFSTMGMRRIRWDIEDFPLTLKQGPALALLVNELVSNAFKHGRGEIILSLATVGGQARLEVCDDGPGFPPDFDVRAASNTGLELTESLSRWDLGGEAAYRNRPEGGACVVVTFPLTEQSGGGKGEEVNV